MASKTYALIALVATALLLGGCVRRLPGTAPVQPPGDEERAFVTAWERSDLAGMRAALLQVPADFDEQLRSFRSRLGVTSSRFHRVSVDRPSPDVAVVTVRAVHTLEDLGDWQVTTPLRFERVAPGWRLRWTPGVLHPDAGPGDRFQRVRSWPARADLLDADGDPLTKLGEVITVGLQPGRIKDRTVVAEALRTHLGVDPLRVQTALTKARADSFLPIIDVRPERFAGVRGLLEPIPGVFFRKKTARLSLAEGFASHTLGRVGEATAEALEALGAPYQASDPVGLWGLERAFERTLAGTPSTEIRLDRPSGGSSVLHRFEGTDPKPVRLHLRVEVQRAAEQTLASVTQPAALAAVDVKSGGIVALVSRPQGSAVHRALSGLYPPGSTFKVVTAEAALAHGLTPASRVSCPPVIAAGPRTFRNFEGEALGTTTFLRLFAHSCNTGFVQLASQVGADALSSAAGRFGFGVEYDPGLPAPQAQFPRPKDAVELASAAIGQGRVLATPLHMATVIAAATSGVWRPPRLVDDDHRSGPEIPLHSGASEQLRTMLRAVVTEGTARAAGRVPGLRGKTGTAEFGSARPPRTHAWFIGVHEEVAFAILVEDGGVGGRVAAPLGAAFVEQLRGPGR